MAEVTTNTQPKRGKRNRKRQSTKVDMTAMVDVAFLLLTFFVLTSQLADVYVLEQQMPPRSEDGPSRIEVAEQKIMTLYLEGDNQVSWYIGNEHEAWEAADLGNPTVRNQLLAHQRAGLHAGVQPCQGKETSGCWDPIFVIKPTDDSQYRNLVDMLDELIIVSAQKYVIAPMTPEDEAWLASR
ncbi:biopolymer transporter ExbD [Pontibacter sp. G13]|uniref:ExbD/TolR family protein n=1 Tax=Pontibacter sp. G13 TaxID=3074898 RepID=UPI00288C03EB|nr:biopolymer transporter ExbD [Pontibacter sp. G13]WNJ16706.1 biopolymer transporter ExbD [Pontibacter sp. G13]